MKKNQIQSFYLTTNTFSLKTKLIAVSQLHDKGSSFCEKGKLSKHISYVL